MHRPNLSNSSSSLQNSQVFFKNPSTLPLDIDITHPLIQKYSFLENKKDAYAYLTKNKEGHLLKEFLSDLNDYLLCDSEKLYSLLYHSEKFMGVFLKLMDKKQLKGYLLKAAQRCLYTPEYNVTLMKKHPGFMRWIIKNENCKYLFETVLRANAPSIYEVLRMAAYLRESNRYILNSENILKVLSDEKNSTNGKSIKGLEQKKSIDNLLRFLFKSTLVIYAPQGKNKENNKDQLTKDRERIVQEFLFPQKAKSLEPKHNASHPPTEPSFFRVLVNDCDKFSNFVNENSERKMIFDQKVNVQKTFVLPPMKKNRKTFKVTPSLPCASNKKTVEKNSPDNLKVSSNPLNTKPNHKTIFNQKIHIPSLKKRKESNPIKMQSPTTALFIRNSPAKRPSRKNPRMINIVIPSFKKT